MIRVLIAEDQTLVAGALAALLGTEHDIEVVGTAGNGRDALDAVETVKPDVLLTDIEMPRMSGLELAGPVLGQATGKIGARSRADAARIAKIKGWL